MSDGHYIRFKKSNAEKYNKLNTLVCIPYILLNKNTLVDLRNETSVAGTIDDVDGQVILTNSMELLDL